MRILALSDKIVDVLYGPSLRSSVGEVDVIVGCGDLPSPYLEYIVTSLNAPLVYVPGNHDADDFRVQGGESIDGRVVQIRGLRFAGLGGSQRYKPQGDHQYTESQMLGRITLLAPRLALARLSRGRGVDVFVTHAPPQSIHDGQDLAHLGFSAFRSFLSAFRPQLMLHGHVHAIRNLDPTETQVLDTRVINVYPYRLIELGVER